MITGLNATPISQILPKIPFWANLSSEEKALVSQRALTKSFNKAQIITSDRSACLGIILILKGGVRISLISDEGREVTLYRAHAGEFCVSTASCVIHQLTGERFGRRRYDRTRHSFIRYSPAHGKEHLCAFICL